ncbi:hypothetical protein LTR86_007321 [Recurvomyces mirabilis]|nr:hypothetical protein LTR86_007321 [Recurvomyces mirabilis]
MAPYDIRRSMATAPSMTSSPMAVIVGKGEAQRTFYVSKDALLRNSGYFRATCKGEWLGGNDGHSIPLPDDDPYAFEPFARFADHGYVFSIASTATIERLAETDQPKIVAFGHELSFLASCWILGDKLLATNFKDANLDALVGLIHTTRRFPTSMHKRVYKSTAGPNGFRRLLVDIAIHKWRVENLMEDREWQEDSEFLKDVVVRYKELGGSLIEGRGPIYDGDCRYHEHGSGECYRTKTRTREVEVKESGWLGRWLCYLGRRKKKKRAYALLV